MVLLPHSAFIGLEGFYIIESAEILHDYHNVPLKNASSMMTATTNYIQWNLEVTKSMGTGQICSLNGGFVISKTSI